MGSMNWDRPSNKLAGKQSFKDKSGAKARKKGQKTARQTITAICNKHRAAATVFPKWDPNAIPTEVRIIRPSDSQ